MLSFGEEFSPGYIKRIDEEMTEERTAYEVSLSKIELVHKPEDEE